MDNNINAPEPNWLSCLPSKQEIAKRLNLTSTEFSRAKEGRLVNKRSKTPASFSDEQKNELEKVRLETIIKLQNNCKLESL